MTVAYIAYQFSGAPANTFKTWNSVDNPTPATANIADLLDDGGTSTGWSLNTTVGAGEGVSGVNSVGSGDAAWVDEAEISEDYHFLGSGESATFEINGLDNSKTYDFEWYGSRDGSGTRIVEISTDGFSTVAAELNCYGNNSNVASFSATPSSGTITVDWRTKSGSDFSYLNALRIEELDASSSVAPLAGRHLQNLMAGQ